MKSEVENELAFAMKAVNLPLPLRDFRFHPKRKWELDFAWPLVKLAVEVQGGLWIWGRHSRPGGYEGDCEKSNEATLGGWRVLRVTPAMVDDGRALALIERALKGTGTLPVPGRL